MATDLEKYRKKLQRLNGSNVIITNDKGEILSFQATYGKKLRMLPGGALERNEMPQDAGLSETEEELGVYLPHSSLTLVAVYMQRVAGVSDTRGFNFLFASENYKGKVESSDEANNPEFQPYETILANKDEWSTAYLRMVIHYVRWREDKTKVNVMKLAEPVSLLIDGKLELI